MPRLTDSPITPKLALDAVMALEAYKRFVQDHGDGLLYRINIKVVEDIRSLDSDRSVAVTATPLCILSGQKSRAVLLTESVVMHDVEFYLYDQFRQTGMVVDSQKIVDLMTLEDTDEQEQYKTLAIMLEYLAQLIL